jgi:DNA-binding transcriptional LysR family regulator
VDLRHLRYFVAVAEEKHFGRAAQRLHIVQPALSMQIRSLEEEIGGALFVRTSRNVELTQAGSLLLVEARRTLAQAERTKDIVQRSLRGETGTVRVGFAGNAVVMSDTARVWARRQTRDSSWKRSERGRC